MILRHTTLISLLREISCEDALDGKYHKRAKDIGHVSFELNPQNDYLSNNLYLLNKRGNIDDYFYLEFDGERLEADGYKIIDKINGIRMTKLEIKITLPEMSEDQYHGIGEYRFIEGKIPLIYLTDDSRERLNVFLQTLK
ncbi:hypothetical protein PMSD_05010 [Paenibacillus macquariensis subsp. defensor]|nr:hypothetical protein PMSD_05010 [Paenibacillus macquariensis subsp. defensor]